MNEIKLIQEMLKERNINAYLIPTSDYHNSEYISSYFKVIPFLTGFTGSAGTLVITQTEARLWTDGRYHIQAQRQLKNDVILMKQGNADVISINEYLNLVLNNNKMNLAFDGRLVTTSTIMSLQKDIKSKITLDANVDLISSIYNDRPELPYSLIYLLDEFFSGESYKSKLEKIRSIMKSNNLNTYVLSSLEDQAWLYNLRADDVLHTPVFLAYTVITESQTILFTDLKKIDGLVDKYLDDNNIIVKSYDDFYDYLRGIKDKDILLDYNKNNYLIYSSLSEKNKIKNITNPTLLLKAVKNEVEIKNIKNAHIKDAVAMTKFMKFLKENKEDEMTELSLASHLKELREEQKGLVDLSFETICAFKEHAAMMHYSATPESNYKVEGDGMLLVDSGGHYLEGTTDITRTFAIGKVSEQMKNHFTTVLKSVIALSEAVFLKGCKGINLDVLARTPIWKELIDYKCGTGHGVGYLLSVHEGPNSFRWQTDRETTVFTEGMITTNEPGIYLENKYGIRIENEMLCIKKGQNEFGEFLGFETITYCPIDLDLINKDLLNPNEINWINNYHKNVYNIIAPKLSTEEQDWLKKYTKEL